MTYCGRVLVYIFINASQQTLGLLFEMFCDVIVIGGKMVLANLLAVKQLSSSTE